jgi:hypothetical protein
MGRSVLAVLSGAILWSLLWISTINAIAAAAPEFIVTGRYIGHVGVLLTFLAASVVYSVAAGYVTGSVAKTRAVQHAVVLGVLQMVLGIGFQVQSWELMPVWYHLSFLALLLPGNVYGAWLMARRQTSAAVTA